MGILAHLRSLATKAAIGIMITASHNPEEDNGLKVVDPAGEMLTGDWEPLATLIANANSEDLPVVIKTIEEKAAGCREEPDAKRTCSAGPRVCFARDTRPSSTTLMEYLIQSLSILNTRYTDYGLLTTPQLHYLVRCINLSDRSDEPTEDSYYKQISGAFDELAKLSAPPAVAPCRVMVDGANGVGALQMRKLLMAMKGLSLQATVTFDGSQGKLNFECGADHVKTKQKPPTGLAMVEGERYASFDGDGDRLIYYFLKEGQFHLLDGDRIAVLITTFIKEKLGQAALPLSLGCVQTAYANGSSTKFMRDVMGVDVCCVATGVKHLHAKALEFDVGVYFEANGHGTVLFSSEAILCLKAKMEDQSASTESRAAATQLYWLTNLINQAIGDAISDLLAVEAILFSKRWSCTDWSALYTDLPNRLMKATVPDRTIFKTASAERQCLSPVGLQDEINKAVAKYPNGRSFVRPSGTEDVVRVYAEAATQSDADTLAEHVVSLVETFSTKS